MITIYKLVRYFMEDKRLYSASYIFRGIYIVWDEWKGEKKWWVASEKLQVALSVGLH